MTRALVRNPFGGGPRQVRRSPEVRSELDDLSNRLVALGASHDDIVELREAWNDPDAEFVVSRRELARLDDATLARMLADMNTEYDEHTDDDGTTSPDAGSTELPPDGEPLIAPEVVDAYDTAKVVDMNIGDTLAWIGGDTERARLVLAQEVLKGDAARKGILEPLESSTSDAPVAQDEPNGPVDEGDGTQTPTGDTAPGS